MGETEKNSSGGDDITSLLPYLSEGFCDRCTSLLETRLQNLKLTGKLNGISLSNGHKSENSFDFCSAHTSNLGTTSEKSNAASSSNISLWGSGQNPSKLNGHISTNSSPASVSNRQQCLVKYSKSDLSLLGDDESDERIRLSKVGRKKDFTHIERVDGKQVNVLKGLELHTKVFSADEQKKIVDFVHSLQEKGRAGKLRERTYSEPSKWKRGKGRVTLQFGCCYNYAVDKKGNPPGIIRDEDVDSLPPMFKAMIKRLVRWNVLPPTCVPNSCIVNIYDEGDCIPPHIDHHDFVRPFCTVSFLTECNILFGAHLKIVGDGEFSGPVSIPLPVGSVLILSGNGADIAKHCVPSVPSKRISITFRKMDDSKLPYKFKLDPELQGLQPLTKSPPTKSLPVQQVQVVQPPQNMNNSNSRIMGNNAFEGVLRERRPGSSNSSPLNLGQDNFPPLGSSNGANNNRRSRGN